uniref:Amino acid transporter transmembrane domain-containing protein n=1 Tax=Amorphochlora amoebiformis TaxID=1561963 RepID=A0A6T6U3F9_9EUKA
MCKVGDRHPYSSSAIRAALVLLTVIVAVLIPSFEIVTSLVGAFSNGIVAFVLPPLCYMYHRQDLGPVEKTFNWVLAISGGLLSAYSTVAVLWCAVDPSASFCGGH